jgi:thiol:disulfide interchange protein DsbC
MERKDIFFAAVLCVALGLHFQFRDKEPSTPEEALQAVLARVEGTMELDRLPLEDAIRQVRGNGELVLVSFEDPNCTYCIKLNKNLDRLDNITLYTFLVPFLSEDSAIKSRRIWCDENPALAWNDWMLKRQLPSGADDCDTTALDRSIELGNTIGIRGVPYVFRAK